jgi:hypothetical protein
LAKASEAYDIVRLTLQENLLEYTQERETLMLTIIDYVQLFALIGLCAFITYTVHEVGNAIHSMLHEND